MALHDEEPLVARLAVWLAAQGVQCHESVITTRDGVVAGYGCVATRKLKKGELLFRVPRKACFGPRAGAPIDAEAPGDTQRRFAVRLLKERALGSASRWHPLLAVLSPAPCPWIWPEGSERFLDGTELEEVLARKRQRLRCERKKIGLSDDAARSREYDAACALVASHLNPWFGGSITPVNATLNYAAAPNVEFEAEGVDTVVARAVRPIAAGEELTQEYCESTAMFLYRYGFVPSAVLGTDGPNADGAGPTAGAVRPLADDAVSISSAALLALVAPPSRHPLLAPRLRLLCAAGALGVCPWDGLDELVTAEIQRDGVGTAKLVGALLLLALDDERWALAEAAAAAAAAASAEAAPEMAAKADGSDDDDADDDDDDDAIAAALVAAAFGVGSQEAQALEQLAGSEGGEDGDPWPALLAQAAALAPVGRRAQIEESITNAIERARHAVRQRHSRLEAATVAPPEERSDGYAASGDAQYGAGRAGKRTAKRARLSAEAGSAEHRPSVPAAETAAISLAGAWRLAQGLRRVEQAILEDALRLLEAASAEKLAVKLG